jgi:hypothetical protein
MKKSADDTLAIVIIASYSILSIINIVWYLSLRVLRLNDGKRFHILMCAILQVCFCSYIYHEIVILTPGA